MNLSRSFGGSLARAWRSLSRRPAYFAIAVSSLAIALGLATTVIAQIDSLLHPFTPIRDVDRTFLISAGGRGTSGVPLRDEAIEALRGTGIFEQIAHVSSGYGDVEIGSGLIRTAHVLASRSYFDLLGMKTRLGRLFATDESYESGVAIVSDRFWRIHFGNAPSVDGATFRLRDHTFRIVGVLGRDWDETHGGEPESPASLRQGLWIPEAAANQRIYQYLQSSFVSRLKTGVSVGAADSVLGGVAARWRAQFGVGRPAFRIYMQSMRPDPLRMRGFQRALVAAAVFILIIASVNVSALTLARGVTRRRDQALRLALGAERRDLLRDVIAELAILAAVGGIAGVAIAYAAMGIMTALTPVDLTWLGFSRPNWSPRVFAGLFAAVLASVALCAVGPSWYVAQIAPAEPLKEASGTTTGRSKSRFQLLIVGELALAMILLFGASLIGKTAHRVGSFPFGYDPRNIARIETAVTAVDTLSTPPQSDRARRLWRRPEILMRDLDGIVERLRGLPDVRNAAWFSQGYAQDRVALSDATVALDSILFAPEVLNIGPGFFRTLGIPIVAGRDFEAGDAMRGAIILDERTARRMFPDGSPIGRMVKLGPLKSKVPWMPVVGIARDAVHGLPEVAELDLPNVIYLTALSSGFMPTFVVRGLPKSRDIGPAAQRTIRDLIPPSAWTHAGKWSGSYESILAGRRFTAALFATLSLASLALATAGLFGVLSYAVGQRMREFSLRVALGAQKANLLRLVFRDSLVMALGGTAIGAFVGLYLGFEVWDWLWGVYPVDAFALVIAEVVLLAVTFGASTLPALRATRADPAEVMRAI